MDLTNASSELIFGYGCVCVGRPRAKAGSEPGELGFMRSKLLNFLESSKYYRPEDLISKFPENGMSVVESTCLWKWMESLLCFPCQSLI